MDSIKKKMQSLARETANATARAEKWEKEVAAINATADGFEEQVKNLQKKIQPDWEATEFPGMDRLACQFLMVLKESPTLMAAMEHGPTLSLAAELLGVDTRGVGGSAQGALLSPVPDRHSVVHGLRHRHQESTIV